MTKRLIGHGLILLLCALTALGLFMPASLADGEITAWARLQTALSAGGTVTLTQNVTAGNGESALIVPAGKTVTLNLNGHTLSRGLAGFEAVAGGYVILNNGTLTITDLTGSGMITGGNNTGNGGAIFNKGMLNLAGGSITGNIAGESGAGVWNDADGGAFTMTGGTITGNTAIGWHGGGIYNGGTLNLQGGSVTGNEAQGNLDSNDVGQGGGILNNGTMNVSGAPVVSGNKADTGNNIYLRAAHPTMTVTGALTDGASLYVTKAEGKGAITSEYSSDNTGSPGNFFYSDNANYGIALVNGEAWIEVPYQITVTTVEHGAVTLDKASACVGETVHLTAEPAEGYWLSAARIYSSDNQLIREASVHADDAYFIMPGQNVNVEAVFSAKKAISTDVQYPFGGITLHQHGTLTADRSTAGGGETVTLTLATDEGYGLKENGMTAYARFGSTETSIPVTEQDDGTWTFVMPVGDYTVDVYAEIEWKNAPPSGDMMPYFYIDSGCTEYGDVTAGSVPLRTPPLNPENLYRPSVTQITLTATPKEGYVFRGWEVVTVNPNGQPAFGYSLPVECDGSNWMLDFAKVDNIYIFRIRAVFAEGSQSIAVDVAYSNIPETINTGSTLTASVTEAYAGEQVVLTADLAEGAKLSAPPQIWYTPREPNESGTNASVYIEPVQNGNTFTFTVPSGINPNDAKVYVTASFEDIIYGISVPTDQDAKVGTIAADRAQARKGETVKLTATVAGNVTFDPAADLTVSYTEGDGVERAVDCTLKNTSDMGTLITYTCTFSMPAHDVAVGAVFTQKDYLLTPADLTDVSPKPETTITVAGFDVSADHVYRRANAGDVVTLSVVSPNSYSDDKLVVRGIYYTLDADATGERHDLVLTYNDYLNPSSEFLMPAGDITLHYVMGISYSIRLNTERAYGTFSLDRNYAFEGETVTITGVPDNSVYAHDLLTCIVRTLGLLPNVDVPATVNNVDGSFTVSFIMPGSGVIASPEFRMQNVPHVRYSYAEGTGLTGSVQDTPARYFILDSTMTELTESWYVVRENVTMNTSLTISGNVNLLLMDGVTLTAKGVEIRGTNRLTLCGQVSGTGQLNTTGSPGVSLMGGGTLEIHGGRLTATGGNGSAGIGGKYDSAMNGTLVVYGGSVSAQGGQKSYQQEYRDSDGMPSYYTVKAGGAGIGGGACGSGGTVVIYGGRVEAEAGMGAGIGAGTDDHSGGNNEGGGSVTILGGYVTTIPHNSPSWYDYWAVGGRKSNSLTLGGDMKVTVNGQTYTGTAAEDKCRSKAVVIISSTAPAVTFHTVSFAAGDEGATGSMNPDYVLAGDTYMLPACGFTGAVGKAFAGWQVGGDPQARMTGDTFTVTGDTTVTALWQSVAFGNPDFEIPSGTLTIGANAFEGVAATVVEIPESCTRIGDYAFRNCGQLTMIRIPAGCELGERVFDGCTKVYVFGTAGSPAEVYCNNPDYSNCVFVEDTQN